MGNYNLSNEPNRKVTTKEKIRVDLSSFRKTANSFSGNLNVQILIKNTNSVLVSLKDAVPARGIAVINALVKRYNQNGIDNKRIVSEATVEFINERLDVINQELGTIERRAEDFKKTNKLTDITSDAAFVMERKKQSEAELMKLQTELDVLRSIRAAITQKRAEEFSLLPENLGLSDEGLNAGITRYNEMVLRRGKLLQSASESNPIVIGLKIGRTSDNYPRGERPFDQAEECGEGERVGERAADLGSHAGKTISRHRSSTGTEGEPFPFPDAKAGGGGDC